MEQWDIDNWQYCNVYAIHLAWGWNESYKCCLVSLPYWQMSSISIICLMLQGKNSSKANYQKPSLLKGLWPFAKAIACQERKNCCTHDPFTLFEVLKWLLIFLIKHTPRCEDCIQIPRSRWVIIVTSWKVQWGINVPCETRFSIGKGISLTCIEDYLCRNCTSLWQFSMFYSLCMQMEKSFFSPHRKEKINICI